MQMLETAETPSNIDKKAVHLRQTSWASPSQKRNLDSMFKEQETEDDSDEMPVLSPEQQFSAELTLYENASVGVSTLCSECAFDPDRVRIDCVHT